MLEELVVRNFALVDKLSVSFENGLNILTGETGAGKSIMVGAIGFLLGSKADGDVIRTGAQEAVVTGVVAIGPKNAEAAAWLAARGIETEDGRILLRRTLRAGGRGLLFIQDNPVSKADLAEFTSYLFDIHGQHSHQSLLKKESHRSYLDRFAGLEKEAADFNTLFNQLKEKRAAMENAASSRKEREEKLEILRFAVDEIEAAKLRPGEKGELEAESARLGDFEKLAGLAASVSGALSEGEPSALGLFRRAKTALEGAAAVDPSLASLASRVGSLFFEAEDAAGEFRAYRDGLAFDPARLEEVEERLALIQKLKKKYAGKITDLIEDDENAILRYLEEAKKQIAALSQTEENREALIQEIAALERDLAARAARLSAKRREGAASLSGKIAEILGHLGMAKARFEAAVRQKMPEEGKPGGLVLGPWGADDIEFLIAPNVGEPLKELAKIASGGELSRVMLAIKTVLASEDRIETLIFDEIDVGIGGEVALEVGKYLAEIARIKQIFCVTHLASIAVRADNHLVVEKSAAGGRTTTTVTTLGREERRQEIARMLAGDSGAAALAHADELLAKYGGAK
jgi:DNA repair protein RecN (Recombination protein N)